MNKISILKHGDYDVYPVTAAKIVFLDDNSTSVQQKLNQVDVELSVAIEAEPFTVTRGKEKTISDDFVIIKLNEIIKKIDSMQNEIDELKKNKSV